MRTKRITTANSSFLYNNLIVPRQQDALPLFHISHDVTPMLNGYAIIPIEQYAKLTGVAVNPDLMKSINKTGELLRNEPSPLSFQQIIALVNIPI